MCGFETEVGILEGGARNELVMMHAFSVAREEAGAMGGEGGEEVMEDTGETVGVGGGGKGCELGGEGEVVD